jgi:hypothetical protein
MKLNDKERNESVPAVLVGPPLDHFLMVKKPFLAKL